MAEFNTFVYGEEVYGGALEIEDVDVLSRRLLLLKLSDHLVVNDLYNDPENYSIKLLDGDGSIPIKRVLSTNERVTDEVILVTENLDYGTGYEVTFDELTTRSGTGGSGTRGFVSRFTKSDSMYKSIPRHFDNRPESNLSGFILGVSRQDELIGGSRADRFGVAGFIEGGELTEPTVNITSPSDSSTVNTDTPTVQGTFSDANRIDVLVDGISVGDATLNSPSNGEWEITLPSQEDGTIVITAIAIGAGYVEDEITITISTP